MLRIEDIDISRCRPHFETQIFEDLSWLGIRWEEPVRRQSEHMDIYRETLARLEGLGVLYPCPATRKEIAAAAGDGMQRVPVDPDGAPLYPGLYKGTSREEIEARIAAGTPYTLRIDLPKALALVRQKADGGCAEIQFDAFDETGKRQRVAARPEDWGDAVIARKDVPTSYHLSVVVDDALQGVSHVVRGKDLLRATDLHRLLQILLDLPAPLYHHHALIVTDEGEKLAKSTKSHSLRALRENGASAADVLNLLEAAGLPSIKDIFV